MTSLVVTTGTPLPKDDPASPQYEAGFGPSVKRAVRSPYLLANIIYLVYVAMILDVDTHEDVYDIDRINTEYLAANCLHLINAWMYFWVWIDDGVPVLSVVMIPEVLNVIEACIYITSSTYYPLQQDQFIILNDTNNTLLMNLTDPCAVLEDTYVFVPDPYTTLTQNLEMAAATISVLAAIGWSMTWFLTYKRMPGRGWTLDDPDIWANATIITGAIMYFVYYIEVLTDRTIYGTYYLYKQADWVYFANAIFYLICAVRDCGFLWYMPTAGRMNFKTKWFKIQDPKDDVVTTNPVAPTNTGDEGKV